ncbi:RxLR effector protein [Phytophthora megakarya]|uniref:RxLR effector protein n=1 Tax=Phytophthora megakarya TaxID=4795 RepID=A0A225WR91_9STRA|nr:RxLR effector protein [Phytophthora megakarya]
MRLSFAALVAIVIVAASSPITAGVDANQVTLVTSSDNQSIVAARNKRVLRIVKPTQENTDDDEERNLFGDFATSKLKKMMKSDSFKLEMFKKWDDYTLADISKHLGYHPPNSRWKDLHFDYLNVYKKAQEEAARNVEKVNKVKFSNKLTLRIYD